VTRRERSPDGGALLDAEDVAVAAQLACLLEASAAKPGNVSPGRHFRDARYEDFLASAAAVGPALALAPGRPLGATVLDAVTRTRRWTQANTNLGIILLLAPLARAAVRPGGTLRERVGAVLRETTVDDGAAAYEAIRAARPGGLGRAEAQDVSAPPTVSLLKAMRLAADRDGIAGEYATDFAATFEVGAPTLAAARADGLDWDAAVVEAYLALLARFPDTHVARRAGDRAAREVSEGAAAVVAAGGVRTGEGRRAVAAFDRSLRDAQNSRNPGTTADLTAAAIFVTLLEGGWHAARGERGRG
jgi:triphosphoribosyl-dephospho-CoA synthase